MGNEQQQQRQQLIVGMDMRFLHNDLTKKPQREEEEEEESACPIVICLWRRFLAYCAVPYSSFSSSSSSSLHFRSAKTFARANLLVTFFFFFATLLSLTTPHYPSVCHWAALQQRWDRLMIPKCETLTTASSVLSPQSPVLDRFLEMRRRKSEAILQRRQRRASSSSSSSSSLLLCGWGSWRAKRVESTESTLLWPYYSQSQSVFARCAADSARGTDGRSAARPLSSSYFSKKTTRR